MLLKKINEVDASLLTKSEPVRESLLAKQERAKQLEEARKRQVQLKKELDANIMIEQREKRRERVASDRRQREELFQKEWDAKKVEAESACLKRTKTWMGSSEFKNQSQKKQKEMQRHLSIKSSSTSNTDRENAITSSAVIGYSILDAKMAHVAGVAPDELFYRLGKIPSPINAIPFQSALVSCGLVLGASEFEEVFNSISQYRQTDPTEQTVDLACLHELRRSASTYIGEEGTRWKMYVHPIHQNQILHNVASGKMIFEKDIKKKLIRQAVNENMQDHELLKARRKHFEARQHAHKRMVEDHAARSIQGLYHLWKGRQTVKKQLWIVERRKLLRLRAKQAGAAALIQAKFRSRRK